MRFIQINDFATGSGKTLSFFIADLFSKNNNKCKGGYVFLNNKQ
jgi:hypothetical protein